MAANYSAWPLGRTVKVISQTEVADVQRIGLRTSPSGVYCETYVPWASWLSEGVDPWATPLASAIEDLFSGGLASGAVFVQDVDPSGLLADFLDVTVEYVPSGGAVLPATTTVRIPVTALTVDTGFAGVLNTYFGGGGTAFDPAQALRDAYDALVRTTQA